MKFDARNKRIRSLPQDDPARRFLEAFMECRKLCVGREIVFVDSPEPPIDQTWWSATDGAEWTFSGFAYRCVSIDIDLDAILASLPSTALLPPVLTDVRHTRTLMAECRATAEREGNARVLPLIEMVDRMLVRWEELVAAVDVLRE